MFPLIIVIFHSYVKLPKGKVCRLMITHNNSNDWKKHIKSKLHIYIHICAHYAYILYIYTHYIVYTYIHIYIGYKYGLSQNMVHTSICNRKVAHHFSMCFLIEMAIKSTAYGIFGSVPAPILTIITLHIYIYSYSYIHVWTLLIFVLTTNHATILIVNLEKHVVCGKVSWIPERQRSCF